MVWCYHSQTWYGVTIPRHGMGVPYLSVKRLGKRNHQETEVLWIFHSQNKRVSLPTGCWAHYCLILQEYHNETKWNQTLAVPCIFYILYTWSIRDNWLIGRIEILNRLTHTICSNSFILARRPRMLESVCPKFSRPFFLKSIYWLGTCRVCSATKDQPPTNDKRHVFQKEVSLFGGEVVHGSLSLTGKGTK